VTALDWGIVAFALIMAGWGYRQGLVVAAMTLAAFAVGAMLGGRLGPALLAGGSQSAYAPATALAGALLVGGLIALSVERAALALRRRLVTGPAGAVLDGSGGALLIAALALAIAWMFGAVALNAPGQEQLRTAVQRSAILRGLNRALPPSGFVLNALHRIDPGLEIRAPRARVAPPDPRLSGDPEVIAAGDSVVRVLGTACGLGVEGSGWVAAPGTVVTNAHVVAGEQDTTVTGRDGGRRYDAVPVHYDPGNDIAVLRVLGLPLDPLAIAGDPRPGTAGALLGYPDNGPFAATPVRVGATTTSISQDSYGNGPLRRLLTSLRGKVRSGNSGGPVVDGAGRVLSTVFASTTSGAQGGFAVPNSIVAGALADAEGEVSTGACAR
jgi:S1-C subfamily serine protease